MTSIYYWSFFVLDSNLFICSILVTVLGGATITIPFLQLRRLSQEHWEMGFAAWLMKGVARFTHTSNSMIRTLSSSALWLIWEVRAFCSVLPWWKHTWDRDRVQALLMPSLSLMEANKQFWCTDIQVSLGELYQLLDLAEMHGKANPSSWN